MRDILKKLGILKEDPMEDIIQDEDDIIASALVNKKYFVKAVPTGADDEELKKIVENLVEYEPIMVVSLANVPDDKKATFAAQLKSAIINIPDRDYKVYYLTECNENFVLLIIPEDYQVRKI